MTEYAAELLDANERGREAYDAISFWLDRPSTSGEQIPTAELEKRVKQLRASRERLLELQKIHGESADLGAAIATNTSYFRNIGVTLPEEAE
jgi:hypothetical protein